MEDEHMKDGSINWDSLTTEECRQLEATLEPTLTTAELESLFVLGDDSRPPTWRVDRADE